MAHIHLIIGPVGAGKSTFGKSVAQEHRAVRLTLDHWMAVLFGADERPATGRIEWYLARRDRCLELIWQTAQQLLSVGTPVVLEVGLIQRQERAEFYERIDAARHPLTVYVVDAPRELRRERVAQRNLERGETFSQEVPPAFFEMASDLWQPPDEDERRDRDVRIVSKP